MSQAQPPTIHPPRRQIALLAVIVLVQILYSAFFIARSSFVIGGERYFVLFDDAMISMRYARNLAAGYGAVWNRTGQGWKGSQTPSRCCIWP